MIENILLNSLLWPAMFKNWIFKLRHSGIKTILSFYLAPLETKSGFATTSWGILDP